MSNARLPEDTLSVDDEPSRRDHGDTPTLFVAFRCDQPLAPPQRFKLAGLDRVVIGRGDAPPRLEAGCLHVSLADPRLSQNHARIEKSDGRMVLRDLRSKNGSQVNGVRVDEVVLADGDLIELGGSFLVYRELDDVEGGGAASILGVDTLLPRFGDELRALRDVARSSVSLLILGETGTGKEVVARAAHVESERTGPLVAVNCAALPATLVESELFGHKKGAFSGADADRVGLVAAAHGGTLFLDEIAELPLAAQAALLRVLQDGEVTPIGGTKPTAYDVRIIAATNRDVAALIDSGRFRADLYARLAGFKLRLWPLRERKEDLGLLIASLVRRLAPARAATVTFSPAAARSLFRHRWSLNIRELEKALAAALVLASGRIERAHLQLATTTSTATATATEAQGGPDAAATRAVPRSPEHDQRRQMLSDALRRHDGNISAVARELGKDRVQIRRWVRMYKLDTKR